MVPHFANRSTSELSDLGQVKKHPTIMNANDFAPKTQKDNNGLVFFYCNNVKSKQLRSFDLPDHFSC